MTNLQKATNLVRALGHDINEFTAVDYINAIVDLLGVSRNNASIYLAKAKRALGFTYEVYAYDCYAPLDLEVEASPTKVDYNPLNKKRK